MRRAVKQIGAAALALLLICIACRLVFFRSTDIFIPVHSPVEEAFRGDELQLEIEEPGVVRAGEPELRKGAVRLTVRPEQAGDTVIRVLDDDGEGSVLTVVRVGRFHTVMDLSSGAFTGDVVVLCAVTAFWLLVSAIMCWHFTLAKGSAFYAYSTIYYAGFAIFSLVTGVVLLRGTVLRLADPVGHNMLEAYSAINMASSRFMQLTTPLIILFALAMIVSNLALLRHEKPHLQNILGILVALALIAGEALGWYLFSRDFMGSELEGRIRSTLENTYATVFVYFECMLAGSVICGITAARRQPALDKDFILILGCWFRPDGSLPPLLRGRADRALAFWREQKARTGREARFIPTGGQGRDEPMPEAEAVRRYLCAQGVPDRLILPETASGTTFQNMRNAKEIIGRVDPSGKAVFATTNYHVFRSGVWASDAGLPAEGIGSGTVWWFWPNAFMRETAGLLVKRWWQELLFLAILIAFFALLSMIL